MLPPVPLPLMAFYNTQGGGAQYVSNGISISVPVTFQHGGIIIYSRRIEKRDRRGAAASSGSSNRRFEGIERRGSKAR